MTDKQAALRDWIRLAGWNGIVGGPALAAAYIAHPSSASPGIVASTSWIWIHVGFMISLLCGVFLLIGLLAEYAARGLRPLGVMGFVLSIISLIFVFGLDYAEVFIFPVLAASHPDVIVQYGDGTSMPSVAFAFPVTGAIFMIGFLTIAWELWRTAVIDRGAALLTMLGTVIFTAGLSGLLPMIVVKVGATLFGAGLVWLGLELRRKA